MSVLHKPEDYDKWQKSKDERNKKHREQNSEKTKQKINFKDILKSVLMEIYALTKEMVTCTYEDSKKKMGG